MKAKPPANAEHASVPVPAGLVAGVRNLILQAREAVARTVDVAAIAVLLDESGRYNQKGVRQTGVARGMG